ncbi:MAG TPA: DinB family protein [Flavisolibacter sp.]
MSADKKDFLRNTFTSLLRQIPSDTPPAWGKMSFQQMIEHFAEYTRIASGKIAHTEILTPPDRLEKMRDFIMSDKPFRENTINPLVPEVPAPVRNKSAEEAIAELQKEIEFFFTVFEKNNLQVTRNPFFGDLNFEQNLQLLYKHALHHLRQFGVTPQTV